MVKRPVSYWPVAIRTLFLLVVWFCSGCGSTTPEVQKNSRVDDVSLQSLLADPNRYASVPVRTQGWCRIEFEGNAIYLDRQSFENRRGNKAIWLNLGWPVSEDIKALNGQYVTVEGRFDGNQKGHEASFMGSLNDVRNLKREIQPN